MEDAKRSEFKEKVDHLKNILPENIFSTLTMDFEIEEIMQNGVVEVENDSVIVDLKTEGKSSGFFVAFEVDDAECVIQTTEVLEQNNKLHKGIIQRILMTRDQKLQALNNDLEVLENANNNSFKAKIEEIKETIKNYQSDKETIYYVENYYFDRYCDIDNNKKIVSGIEHMSGRNEFYDIKGNKKPEQNFTTDIVSLDYEKPVSAMEAINKEFSNDLYLTKNYRKINSNTEILNVIEEPTRSL